MMASQLVTNRDDLIMADVLDVSRQVTGRPTRHEQVREARRRDHRQAARCDLIAMVVIKPSWSRAVTAIRAVDAACSDRRDG
jgi:hypothetical protein